MNNNTSSSKNSKNKISGEKIILRRKINGINIIPKKGRFYQNSSACKIMMSSTNYTNCSNNASNSFKEEINNKSNININTSFNEIQNKLENIKKRTENLFEVFYSMNKSGNSKNCIIKRMNFPYNMNIKINKLEKIKK